MRWTRSISASIARIQLQYLEARLAKLQMNLT